MDEGVKEVQKEIRCLKRGVRAILRKFIFCLLCKLIFSYVEHGIFLEHNSSRENNLIPFLFYSKYCNLTSQFSE